YGWSVQPRTTDELFAVAYLAKKFGVPGLTKLIDCLLKFLPKSWKSYDNIWEVGLKVSKLLDLVQTRLAILKFLVNFLSNIDDNEKTERIIMKLEKDDLTEVEQLMMEVYGQLNTNEIRQESCDDGEDGSESDSSESEVSCDVGQTKDVLEKHNLGNNQFNIEHKKEATGECEESSSESDDESSKTKEINAGEDSITTLS
ncbi:4099_t:CDS:2, partial [Scutellospora calospora]